MQIGHRRRIIVRTLKQEQGLDYARGLFQKYIHQHLQYNVSRSRYVDDRILARECSSLGGKHPLYSARLRDHGDFVK